MSEARIPKQQETLQEQLKSLSKLAAETEREISQFRELMLGAYPKEVQENPTSSQCAVHDMVDNIREIQVSLNNIANHLCCIRQPFI